MLVNCARTRLMHSFHVLKLQQNLRFRKESRLFKENKVLNEGVKTERRRQLGRNYQLRPRHDRRTGMFLDELLQKRISSTKDTFT